MSESEKAGMSRRDFLFGAAAIGAAAAAEACRLPSGEKEKKRETELVAKTRSGDWELDARAVGTVVIREEKKTLYHFLKRQLEEQPWFPALPEKDTQAIIDGYIQLIHTLNPGVDLDTFSTIDGRAIQFPVETDVLSRPSTEISKGHGGYSRVQELAKADGFDIADRNTWQTIYENALVHTVEVPKSGEGYYLDRKGSEDSEAQLEQDVLERLEAMGRDFASRSFGGRKGWKLSLTDFLRSPAVQRARHTNDKGTPLLATTHYTGRTFDVPDGRFLDPDENLVTWSLYDAEGNGLGPNPNTAPMIDAEMRPALVEVMTAHGFYPYREGQHWHAYAPKEHRVDLRALETN